MATSTRSRKTFRIAHSDTDIHAQAGTSLTRTMTAEELGVGLGVFVVKGAQLVTVEGAVGPSVTAFTVSVGRNGATTAWLNAADMVQASPPVVANGSALNLGYNVTDVEAEACRLTFTATGANMSVLTAGEAILLLDIEQLGVVE